MITVEDWYPTPLEIERRRRIQVAVWAYAYELEDDSIVSDAVFDETCRQIDVSMDTDRPDLDLWFTMNFNPSTGMWVHNHPDLPKLREIYLRLRRDIVTRKN